MKVLYILGSQRGGTTIVGRILGLLTGVAYAGEVRRFWEFGVAPERRCGCAELLADCPVWSIVLDQVRAAGIDPSDVAAWQREVAPVRGSWRTPKFLPILRKSTHGAVAVSGYDRAVAATYAGLAEAYGVDVIIDNSKLPRDGARLAHTSGVTPFYLHVVRDARGVVASQLRRRPQERPLERSIEVPVLAAGWALRHVRSAQVASSTGPGRRLRVRYEDFVADPGATTAAVCRLLELPPQPVAGGRFDLPAVHTPKGPNPATTATLVEDISWRTELNVVERGLVTTFTSPWLLRDGYLRRRRRSAAIRVPSGRQDGRHDGAYDE